MIQEARRRRRHGALGVLRRCKRLLFRRSHKTELRCHVDQISKRGRFHLPHHATPMRFYRYLADAKLKTDLLVQSTHDDQSHYVLLAPAERLIPFTQFPNSFLAIECSATALDRLMYRAQQNFVAERLCQKFDGTSLHRSDSRRHVAIACDENDWHVATI